MATTLPNTGAIIPAMTEPADQAINNEAFTAIDTKIGKLLNNGGTLTGAINFNSLPTSRYYAVLAINLETSTGAPPYQYGSLFVFDVIANSPVQFFLDTRNLLYTRVFASGSWTTWSQK